MSLNFPPFCPMCHEEVEVEGKCIKCIKDPMRSVILMYGTEEEKNQQMLKDDWTEQDEQEYIRNHYE